MARILTSNTDRGRTGFSGFLNRRFRRSVRTVKVNDPTNGRLNTPISEVPMYSVGAKPTYTTALVGTNNDLVFTAVDEGPEGEEVTIEYLTQDVTPADLAIEVNDKDITVHLEMSAGDKATATIMSDGTNPSNNDTLTVNGRVYTFKGTLTGAADEIKIGADAATTLDNVKSAINASAGAGTAYGTGTTANADVTATTNTDTTQVLEAISGGDAGNDLTLAEGSTHLTVTTFSGGGANTAIASIADDISAAVNADPDASKLVSVTDAAANDGTGLVTALTRHNLVSGAEGTHRPALPPALANNVTGREVNTDQWVGAPIAQTGSKRGRQSVNRRIRKR